jgi:2-succinyl-5-enolpyruvyl-6-hydroxy-3-cyclohexene-1-carboxylate synthase
MQKNLSQINTHFAHILFASLKDLGICDIFMAPGSRSCPLSLAAHHYAEHFYTHFDERALAFMALGFIKQHQKPACVITTSGTAAGNLMPAIMEAYNKKLPLILITADRPQELHLKGANQTIKQADIFKDFTSLSLHFEAPTLSGFNEKSLGSFLSFMAFKANEGPVHLNMALHEPLFDQSVDFPHDVEFRKECKEFDPKDIFEKTGFIILGEEAVTCQEDALYFEKLSCHLDAPIFADISSGYRDYDLKQVRYYPLFIETLDINPEYLLHFGAKITSKSLENFIKRQNCPYIHFDESSSLYDPYHKITKTIRNTKDVWLKLLEGSCQNRGLHDYFDTLNEVIDKSVFDILNEYPNDEEALYIHTLNAYACNSLQIFIGNSLPIRHMDSFYFPKFSMSKTFTQRGVSGIDGLIATACGISTNKNLTLAFLGDLSSLYDINSLSLISQNNLPLIPIIFNNHGGGIFSHLPIAHQTPHFDKIMATKHNFYFQELAHGFDLCYKLISSVEDFEDFLKNPEPYTLLEIITSSNGNVEFLEACKKTLVSLLKSFPKYQSHVSSSMDSWVVT